jgi:trimethylamine:corrinoid methyltransferase-like protein
VETRLRVLSEDEEAQIHERTMNFLLPMLSWPDLIVGAGLMGGSMILSLEQLVIDAKVFRMPKQAHGVPHPSVER